MLEDLGHTSPPFAAYNIPNMLPACLVEPTGANDRLDRHHEEELSISYRNAN